MRALRPAAVVAALALGWIVIGLVLGDATAIDDPTVVSSRLDIAAGALGLVAGGTCILRWHLEGTASGWWFGWALLSIGVAEIAVSAPDVAGDTATVVTGSALTVALVLFVIGLRAPEIDTAISIARTTVLVVGTTVVAFVLGVALVEAGLPEVFPAAVATGYFAAALLVVRHRLSQPDAVWLPLCLVTLGAAEWIAFAVDTGFGTVGAAGFRFVALTGAAMGAIWSVTAVAVEHRSEALHAGIEREEAGERLRTVEEDYAHRMHEVRSSVTALAGGVRNLESTDQVDARLAVALEAELERLRGLVARDDHEADHLLSRFSISASLTPTLEVCASAGWPVSWALDADERAYGRPADVAQIVHGLVANARRHAPDSPIEVSTAVDGEHVLVRVEDRGPGVARSQRERVFAAGVRLGTTGEGDGLGLAIARRLAREMLAELWVQPRAGGGATFVLSLRRAYPSSRDERASSGLRLAP